MGKRIICYQRVRRKDIIAEVTPSFRAVKNPDAKIVKPIKAKESAKIRKPSKPK